MGDDSENDGGSEQEGKDDGDRVPDNDFEKFEDEIQDVHMDKAHLVGLENRKGKLPVFSDDDKNALVLYSEDEKFDEIRKMKVDHNDSEDEEDNCDGQSKMFGVNKVLLEHPLFRESTDMKDPKFEVGLTFTSGSCFQISCI